MGLSFVTFVYFVFKKIFRESLKILTRTRETSKPRPRKKTGL